MLIIYSWTPICQELTVHQKIRKKHMPLVPAKQTEAGGSLYETSLVYIVIVYRVLGLYNGTLSQNKTKYVKIYGQKWWLMLIILAFKKQKQENYEL